MREQWKLITGLILVILVAVFALQNINQVEVIFFFVTIKVPLVLVILLSLLFGVIMGVLASVSTTHHQKNESKGLKQSLEKLRQEKIQQEEEAAQTIKSLRHELVAAQSQSGGHPSATDSNVTENV